MKKDIKKNYIYNLLYQMLSLITPLITTPYISKVLGAELIGRNSFASSIVSYFCLFAAMGTVSYGQREISYLQDNKERRSAKFWNIELLSCISVSVAFTIYLFYVLIIPRDKILAIILTINILTVAVDISWLFQGMEEFGRIATRNIIFKLLHLTFILLFIKSKSDLYLYVGGNVLFNLVSAFSLWLFLPKHINRVDFNSLHPYKELFAVWSLFVPTIAISVYTLLDKTMIGWFTDTSFQNGIYEQSTIIVRFILTFVTSLGTVMIPRIGFCFEKKDFEKIENYMYRSYNFVWLLGFPLCFGIIAIAPNFIPWFLGSEFIKAIPLIRVLALLLLAIGVNNVTGIQYLIPTKRQRLFTKSVLIGAGINFLLNLCLIPNFEAVGAAVASVISEATIAGVQIIWVRNELKVSNIFSTMWRYIIAGLVMLFILTILTTELSPSIVYTVLLVAIGSIVYFLVLIILKEQLFFYYVKLLFVKTKRIIFKKIH